ncbi:MAG: PorV/PorQ family protein [Endomicrobiaceae bacterium]|nr:PorV/PorQ family protein [Endomicrobiaceae bacterium]
MFQILQMPTNAYDAALANTSSMSDNSVLVNPSIIPFVDKSIILSHAIYLQDTKYSIGAINIPIKEKSGLNFSFCYFDMGSMDRTVEYDGGYISGGSFNADDKALNVAYGFKIGEDYSAGVSLKYIDQKIDDVSYSGFAASLSGLYFISNTMYLNLGLNNLGPDVSGYSLPTNLYCSFVSPIGEKSMGIIQIDDYYNDEIIDFKIATETGFEDILFLRLGYNWVINKNYDGTNNDFINNLTLGLGIKLKGFFVDYAWLPKGDLGNIHMFTLRINI